MKERDNDCISHFLIVVCVRVHVCLCVCFTQVDQRSVYQFHGG